jgi:hypothetical protein
LKPEFNGGQFYTKSSTNRQLLRAIYNKDLPVWRSSGGSCRANTSATRASREIGSKATANNSIIAVGIRHKNSLTHFARIY